jgi:TrmH family RNA methyltransferase
LVRAALAAGLVVSEQFVLESASPVPGTRGEVHFMDANTLERVASTVTPQPVIAIVEMHAKKPQGLALRSPAASQTCEWILVADRVGDPGNLGTMIRSAVAAGASAVVTTPNSVDLFSPKVVRAAAGALFAVDVFQSITLSELADSGWPLFGTTSHPALKPIAYDEADLSHGLAIVMGNEAAGLSPDAPVSQWLTIPHVGPVESLNVAMATTVLCFEVARQRKHRSTSESAH